VTTPADVPARARLSVEDRVERLNGAIAQETGAGGRLKSHTATHAVIAYGGGKVLLHITFAVLTLFTCGFFVFPWIVWANTMRERRVTLEVDPYGNVIRSGPPRLPTTTPRPRRS
jgi:hypothetical protein